MDLLDRWDVIIFIIYQDIPAWASNAIRREG